MQVLDTLDQLLAAGNRGRTAIGILDFGGWLAGQLLGFAMELLWSCWIWIFLRVSTACPSVVMF